MTARTLSIVGWVVFTLLICGYQYWSKREERACIQGCVTRQASGYVFADLRLCKELCR